MGERDDFSNKTKRDLRDQAGGLCSFPTCRILTTGPSDAGPSKISNIGVAAHISAASEGGPRWDEKMSRAERLDITNGIWLCQNHAHLIDNPPNNPKYTVEKLKAMKETHEKFIQDCLEGNKSPVFIKDAFCVVSESNTVLSVNDLISALFAQSKHEDSDIEYLSSEAEKLAKRLSKSSDSEKELLKTILEKGTYPEPEKCGYPDETIRIKIETAKTYAKIDDVFFRDTVRALADDGFASIVDDDPSSVPELHIDESQGSALFCDLNRYVKQVDWKKFLDLLEKTQA